MRDVFDGDTQDVRATEAVARLCDQVQIGIGACDASLGGLDQLVCAGGIGEHAPTIHVRISTWLGFVEIALKEPDTRRVRA